MICFRALFFKGRMTKKDLSTNEKKIKKLHFKLIKDFTEQNMKTPTVLILCRRITRRRRRKSPINNFCLLSYKESIDFK